MDDPRREPGGPLSGRPPEADRYGPPTDGPPYSRHRRHGHSRGTPPPWWPQDEPWPPPGGWRVRRRFVRRIALLLLGFIFLIVVLSGLWGTYGPGAVYGNHMVAPRPYHPFFVVGPLLVIVLVGGYIAWRVLRRTAAPVADVMEAADRVAAGDYTTRVDPRGSDEVRRLAGSFNEMTRRLQLNEEQRRALLADVAHELRTPLSVVRGNVEGMLDGVIPRDDERLASLLAATQRMTRLLEDLQTLSTAQAGVLHLHREPTDPRRLVDDVVRAFAPLAGERGVSLTAQADGAPELEADPMRLRQVLDNLVANAVRYTPQGGSVVVHSWRAGDDVLFAVADSGRGMAPDELAHLFERFSKSADSKGSGLGLAIARSLVESHGGQIAAQSEPGHGTTITFRLPLTPPR
ncbi:MAG TPA: ATP-binding protein [Thermoleophilia bacterium]|nr:ATP-binding protein [Thermoleophilia bacterium]